MAESADALDSGSSGGNPVEVQVLLAAPKRKAKLNSLSQIAKSPHNSGLFACTENETDKL